MSRAVARKAAAATTAAAETLEGARGRVRQSLMTLAGQMETMGLPRVGVRGQLIRPLASYAAGRACGCGEWPRVWSAALAVQLAHEASLVHDDIVDGAATRRGDPTLAALAGVGAALVAGDHLLAWAYRMAARTGSLAFADLFAEAVEATIAGEVAQGRAIGRALTAAEYERIARDKAGALLGCALAAPVAIAGRAESSWNVQVRDLYELGRTFGLLYQRLDDLLDYCPGTDTGKPPLGDHAQRRWTWVMEELPPAVFGAPADEALAALHAPDASGETPIRRLLERLETEFASFHCQRADLLPGDSVLAQLAGDWLERARDAVRREEIADARRMDIPTATRFPGGDDDGAVEGDSSPEHAKVVMARDESPALPLEVAVASRFSGAADDSTAGGDTSSVAAEASMARDGSPAYPLEVAVASRFPGADDDSTAGGDASSIVPAASTERDGSHALPLEVAVASRFPCGDHGAAAGDRSPDVAESTLTRDESPVLLADVPAAIRFPGGDDGAGEGDSSPRTAEPARGRDQAPVLLPAEIARRIRERVPAAGEWRGYMARNSRSFAFAARFFPAGAAEKVARVYAYCRVTDDLVDRADGEHPAALDAVLTEWAGLSRRAYDGGPTGIELLDRAMGEMASAGVPFRYAAELAEGMRMDLRRETYPTMAALRVYTYRVASVVGQWMTELFGVHDAATLQRAAAMGHAMQLTNILRDVGEDARAGRLYLPADLMRRHGVSINEMAAMAEARAGVTPAYAALLGELMRAADDDYALAFEAIPWLPDFFQRPVAVAAHVYRGIHDAIRRNGYDNLRLRARTTAPEKLRLATRALWDLRAARRRAAGPGPRIEPEVVAVIGSGAA